MNKEQFINEYYSLFVYIALVLGIVLAVLGIVFIRPAAKRLGADGELLENCVTYGRIILLALPFFITSVMFQSFFIAAEKPKMGMLVTVFSGVINMLLDAVLVMSLPQEMKLTGAAIAMAVAQFFGGAFPLVYFSRKNSSILRIGKTKWNGFLNRYLEIVPDYSFGLGRKDLLPDEELRHFLGY